MLGPHDPIHKFPFSFQQITPSQATMRDLCVHFFTGEAQCVSALRCAPCLISELMVRVSADKKSVNNSDPGADIVFN